MNPTKFQEFQKALEIIETVCDMAGITPKEMEGACREVRFSHPRMLAMALVRKLTELSHCEIRDLFKKRDHTSVIHARKRLDSICQGNPKLAKIRQHFETMNSQEHLTR